MSGYWFVHRQEFGSRLPFVDFNIGMVVVSLLETNEKLLNISVVKNITSQQILGVIATS